jgi:signal transduction histidine kinase
LENAFKYSSPRSKPVEISARIQTNQIVITIRDHGCGIPEDDLKKVFEPFYRVDRSRSKNTGGFGLGLSLCKRIMEAHGGKISLKSRLHEGTMVELELPMT